MSSKNRAAIFRASSSHPQIDQSLPYHLVGGLHHPTITALRSVHLKPRLFARNSVGRLWFGLAYRRVLFPLATESGHFTCKDGILGKGLSRSVQIFDPFEPRQDRDSARRRRWACRNRLSACYADTMRVTLNPFRLLLISLAGYLNQQQQEVIEYLQEENQCYMSNSAAGGCA
jgi:hypothetical protein